jgi:pimeloyl-ACP methyl ester carboxylesterase
MANWPEPKLVDAGGVKLATYEYGNPSSPAVLMLHGFLSTGLTWHDVSSALAKDWHVIAVDQRGRSFSDPAPGGDYSTDAYVRDACGVLKALHIERVAAVGHSMGGANAIALAATHPEAVTSLVVVDMAPELNTGSLTQVAAGVAALGRDFADWDEAREWQHGALPLISDDAVERRLRSRMVERNGRIVWREDPGILADRDRRPFPTAEERWKLLRAVRCRTLFLLGGDSALVSDETAEKAAKTVPGGEWTRIPRAGHNVFEDNPADSIAAITRFLAGDERQQG